MTIKNQDFKYNIGEKVSGHKPKFGKVEGTITGRTKLEYGTNVYWVRTQYGKEFVLPEFNLAKILKT